MAARSIDAPPAPALPLHHRLALHTCLVFTAIAMLVPPHASPTHAPVLISARLLLTAANYLRRLVATRSGCTAFKRCGRASQAPPCTAPDPAPLWKHNH
ncbi:hypothetical protein DNX69_00260 [Rhodopseudomonas palustris]|uniref:Uncharacterized protein n=1 Tax=Rhodopseudomonas palustris TaxID=1076 RepID=A0A323UNG8_RHOPL|nr:hypothetical protein DNX69_00260 [Rhodopseudomonas palustris]